MKAFKILLLAIYPLNVLAANISGNVEIKGKSGDRITDTCRESVVFLSYENKARKSFAPGKDKFITAKNRVFHPSVLPIVKGTKVGFPNLDIILHNVFSLSKTKKFDLGLYPKGPGKYVTFEKTGLVKVFCNIHPGMVSNVLVLDNPYFARVDKKCRFEIKNIPNDSYTVNLWYRFGKGETKKITLKENRTYQLGLNAIETKKRINIHKNKHGKTYRNY